MSQPHIPRRPSTIDQLEHDLSRAHTDACLQRVFWAEINTHQDFHIVCSCRPIPWFEPQRIHRADKIILYTRALVRWQAGGIEAYFSHPNYEHAIAKAQRRQARVQTKLYALYDEQAQALHKYCPLIYALRVLVLSYIDPRVVWKQG